MKNKETPLTKCEDCERPLPVHLVELTEGEFGKCTHTCSCEAHYRMDDGKFIRDGEKHNPIAAFDRAREKPRRH